MDGLLVIDKPDGPTSHDVVARVRRATRWSKIGHTGTLDPMATGVLPLVVGRATRLARFFSASDKEYEAEIRLGWATDTHDALGTPIPVASPSAEGPVLQVEACGSTAEWPPPDALEGLLARFRGSYLQAPPSFSAKKHDGVRAYAMARRGQVVAPRPTPVTVHELVVLARAEDRLRLRVRCSAGFYVRMLAHELGVAVGCGAHLCALRRTRTGDYGLDAATPLDAVEQAGDGATRFVIPIGSLLLSMPGVVVTAAGAQRTRHGNELRPADCLGALPDTPAGRVRVVDEQGTLLALAMPAPSGLLHPDIVVV